MYQQNQGKSAAVNAGIRATQGKYVTVLDADDELASDGLKQRVRALERDPSADLAFGGFAVIDEDGERVGAVRFAPKDPQPASLRKSFYLSVKTPFHFSACLLHRDLVDRVGLFDADLIRCQDGDYAIRSLGHARGVVSVDEVVYLYRKHRSERRDRIQMRMSTLRHRPSVLLKNFSFPQNYLYALIPAMLDLAKLFYEVFSNYER